MLLPALLLLVTVIIFFVLFCIADNIPVNPEMHPFAEQDIHIGPGIRFLKASRRAHRTDSMIPGIAEGGNRGEMDPGYSDEFAD